MFLVLIFFFLDSRYHYIDRVIKFLSEAFNVNFLFLLFTRGIAYILKFLFILAVTLILILNLAMLIRCAMAAVYILYTGGIVLFLKMLMYLYLIRV